MVTAAANLHGLLLEHTHARRSLAGIEHSGTRSLQPFHILTGHGGDTAHALHDVQHQTLRLQQRTHLAGDNHSDVALLHLASITHQHLDLHLRVEAVEHFLSDFHAGQDTVFLNQEMALAHRILGDAAQGGMVAVANVLGKRQVNKSVDQFVNTQHSNRRLEDFVKIDTEAYAQAKTRVVLEALGTHVVIEFRLNGNGAADEEGVAHIDIGQEIIIAFGVLIVSTSTEIDAVLTDVITHAGTNSQIIRIFLMNTPMCLSQCHHIVHKEITDLAVDVEIPLGG